MTLSSDRLQLLHERHLEFLIKFRTQLLNHPCFGDTTEVDGLISQLHSELENDCSLHESSTNRISNDTAAIHDPPSGPEMSNSEACPVVGSNPTVSETCTDSEVSSSLEDPLVLPENMSHASNNSQEPGTVLLHTDCPSDQLSTSKIFK
ncbi:unnamed protein product [Schistosoma mattheei]|uniref:Uncharacterized protein n=1 Tax=Schistosoma mattheei TaxID=31246 RepID=A0AA85BWH0_9TREM|nr:unnamed protein product [Schistosoma mattheei]